MPTTTGGSTSIRPKKSGATFCRSFEPKSPRKRPYLPPVQSRSCRPVRSGSALDSFGAASPKHAFEEAVDSTHLACAGSIRIRRFLVDQGVRNDQDVGAVGILDVALPDFGGRSIGRDHESRALAHDG